MEIRFPFSVMNSAIHLPVTKADRSVQAGSL